MHEYDTALKRVLQRLTAAMLKEVTGYPITRWHNVELPEIHNWRVDLLGETNDGLLVHIELQSTNDADMARRMAEYALAIWRRFGRMPVQVVLYVGDAPARMKTSFAGPHLSFACPVFDIRNLDGEQWLVTNRLEDSLIAVLMRFANQLDAIRKILDRIAASDPASRSGALAELFILARLRKMEDIIKREASQMPILNDIMDHKVFGPLIRQGRIEGERVVVLRLLTQRFGPLPDWAKSQIEAMGIDEIDHLALRLLDAPSLDNLLR